MSKFKRLLYTIYIRKAYYTIIETYLRITDETASENMAPDQIHPEKCYQNGHLSMNNLW